MEKNSTADKCISIAAIWPLLASAIMIDCTIKGDTIFFDKLHFLQVKLADLLQ
ncbi:MAG: hypothetical protein LBS68_01035 [Puniceicoccales bacterium]|nr:hypothetical protein [Puniceicoccales bacterium]